MVDKRRSSGEAMNTVQPESPKMHRASTRWQAAFLVAALGLLLGSSAAWSQLTTSIAFQGPSAPGVEPGGALLTTPGPGATPTLLWGPVALGLLPGTYGQVELDALSWGEDTNLQKVGSYWGAAYHIVFSTDEFADGMAGLAPPSVRSEGSTSNLEASADVQRARILPTHPAPPVNFFYGHRSVLDGNGVGIFTGPELGLVEPNIPTAGPDSGDTLDALDFLEGSPTKLYFSLDGGMLDPLEAPYGNSDTALANSVNPGDVLVSNGSGSFFLWAPAASLGLSPLDDLDALALWENGNGSFDPSLTPFDWMGGSTDMLLFSVRRGSPIIGTVDSHLGIPIEEGDILTTPCNIFPCPGGPAPAIFLRAEWIGLAAVRSATTTPPAAGFGDDLNALLVR